MKSTQRIEKAIEILRWCIANNQNITKGCSQFEVSLTYVKQAKSMYGHLTNEPLCVELVSLYKTVTRKGEIVTPPNKSSGSKSTTTPKDTEPITKESIQFDQSDGVVDAKGYNHVKTLDAIIAEAKIDTRIWDIERHVINKWDVTNAEGQTYQNWQVKVWLKKREEVADAINFEQFFKESLAEHNPYKYKPVAYKKSKEHNLLEISLYDLHLGKLCWSEEVENNYDTKIASARFNYALQTLVQRAESFEYEKILFVVGNDFFNSDGHLNQTTMGTRQDEDSRWQKTFKTGEKLIIEGIDFLRQFAPVDVKVIPGNHDWTKSFFLGEVLAAWYREDKCVTIDNRANPRKYYRYGNNLLGLTHGNNEKPEALRSLMAMEAKQDWAETLYREWHVGHQHRKISFSNTMKSNMIFEELAVVIRHMSALAGTDAWHHTMGYKGPIRAAEAFLWNKEAGLVCNFNVNIKLHDDK